MVVLRWSNELLDGGLQGCLVGVYLYLNTAGRFPGVDKEVYNTDPYKGRFFGVQGLGFRVW